MDIRLLREYKNRWQAVAELEREERRTASMKNRWEQLNYLYLLARRCLYHAMKARNEPSGIVGNN